MTLELFAPLHLLQCYISVSLIRYALSNVAAILFTRSGFVSFKRKQGGSSCGTISWFVSSYYRVSEEYIPTGMIMTLAGFETINKSIMQQLALFWQDTLLCIDFLKSAWKWRSESRDLWERIMMMVLFIVDFARLLKIRDIPNLNLKFGRDVERMFLSAYDRDNRAELRN